MRNTKLSLDTDEQVDEVVGMIDLRSTEQKQQDFFNSLGKPKKKSVHGGGGGIAPPPLAPLFVRGE
jgi:hypothetical protein